MNCSTPSESITLEVSDSYQSDEAAWRIIARITGKMGAGMLPLLYSELAEEGSHNISIAERYGLKLFEVCELRRHPWVIIYHLTEWVRAQRHPAVVLQFKQRA